MGQLNITQILIIKTIIICTFTRLLRHSTTHYHALWSLWSCTVWSRATYIRQSTRLVNNRDVESRLIDTKLHKSQAVKAKSTANTAAIGNKWSVKLTNKWRWTGWSSSKTRRRTTRPSHWWHHGWRSHVTGRVHTILTNIQQYSTWLQPQTDDNHFYYYIYAHKIRQT